MDIVGMLAYILLVGVLIKEISYFTPHMMYTHKSVLDYVVFVCGILVLLFLTVKFASGYIQISFGVIGILAFGAMWLKQGISTKGVLTIARGKEFYPWKSIAYVKINKGKELEVTWFNKDSSILVKQKYSIDMLSSLHDRIKSYEVKEI